MESPRCLGPITVDLSTLRLAIQQVDSSETVEELLTLLPATWFIGRCFAHVVASISRVTSMLLFEKQVVFREEP